VADDDGIRVHFEGRTYPLDEFTLGELEWLEEHLGASMNDVQVLQTMKAAVGVVYLIKRRDDPAFTLEQAREVKLATLDAPDTSEDAEEPGAGPPRRPTRAAKGKSAV
jgi:hypothetical protein